VILGHCRYQKRGGEEAVFAAEARILREAGVAVEVFEDSNDRIAAMGPVRAGLESLWSRRNYRDLSKLIRTFRPDVVHFHNTFPAMSASVFAACAENDAPTVMTLHNFRLFCVHPSLLRDGAYCDACCGKSAAWPALRFGCFRGSRAASAFAVANQAVHALRASYDQVERFICLNQTARRLFARHGLPDRRLVVKPNSVRDPGPPAGAPDGRALFLGRLSAEKGVDLLLETWRRRAVLPLRIAGDGPLRPAVEAAARDGVVEYLGELSHAEAACHLRDAACLLLPTRVLEGMPMTVLEAFSHGVPVVASRLGVLEEMIPRDREGRLFDPGSSLDLIEKLESLTPREPRARAAAAAREAFEERYTEAVNRSALQAIYADAIADYHERRRHRP
jgi:glycosyltransferase involved in cell wall biosynthesis